MFFGFFRTNNTFGQIEGQRQLHDFFTFDFRIVDRRKICGDDTNITGNLAEMIQHVVAISKETLAEGTSVMPYLAVDGVVVSGKE